MICLESVELREISLPLIEPFETSCGRTVNRRIILVSIRTSDSMAFGECTAGEEPTYSAETTDTAWHILSDFVVPVILQNDLRQAADFDSLFGHIRGHRMTKAALETAIWDLEARSLDKPLWEHIGGVRTEIDCGVSIGIQENIDQLITKVRKEVQAGYRRIKIKIKPGWEIEPVSAIRREFPDLPLMVDANSSFLLDHLQLLQRLDQFNLMMIEQPLAHDDIVDHAVLQRELQTPVCLDESIRSAGDVRKAVEMGSCRIVNVKLGRVGGFNEAIKINRYCTRHGIPVWCGGMLEGGIGRAHNIAMSTLSGFSLPGDVSASKRYFFEDIVDPPVIVTESGTIKVSNKPGIGYDINWKIIDKATVRQKEFKREGRGS